MDERFVEIEVETMIEVIPFGLDSKKDLKTFINLPWNIYKYDDKWVPPLKIDIKAKFSRKGNPFLSHSEIQPFICYKQGRVCGRIVGIINNNHNQVASEKTGFFGFFESINDFEVADALLNKVYSWIKDKGMSIMRGPANFSSNDDWGSLVDSYNVSPMVMMPYNPEYYNDFYIKYGLRKVKDVLAYRMSTQHKFPERVSKIIERVRKRLNITIRNIKMKEYTNEVNIIKDIYNKAWEQNWGFVPMTDDEFSHLAKDLKTIADPRFIFFAIAGGNHVGISVCIPNINEGLIKIKNGRLLPFGIFKLLYHIKKVKSGRLLILGVTKDYRNKGIEPLLFEATLNAARDAGWDWGEMSWVLEDNILMRNSIEKAGGEPYKTYRLYEKQII